MQTVPAPPPTRVDTVVDEMHGHTIADPYRWLEDSESTETELWVEEQNAYTRSLLDAVPGRDVIHRRLTELLTIGMVTAPRVRDGRYFYMRREGHQNQPVLCLREGREGEERVLLDPNTASAEGTVALDWWYPSEDGKLLAYGYSANGDEWSTLFILDVDSGELRPERIERARYASVAWLPDGSGFYYTRYPNPGDVPEGEENYHVKIFFHTLGADPASDPMVEGIELGPEDMSSVGVSSDRRYLIVNVHHGWQRSDLYMRPITSPDRELIPVAVGYDALFDADVADGVLYLHTNLDAPRYRLFRASPDDLRRESWEEIISESPDAVLETASLIGGRIVARYLRNATSALEVHDLDGSRLVSIDLPALGSISAVSGRWEEPDLFYSFESFTFPPTVYCVPVSGGESSVWAGVEAPLKADDYTVTQEWYTSRDGTRVSMFIVHTRDLDRSRPHPAVLTGYGGFNVSMTPLFSRALYLWLEHGGIFAMPNLRGGAEYGEEWHRAGMLDRKQNVFDDFIAAAEYLIRQGYTEPSRLGISGGSNGGLLVGAALTQRPDLFRSVVCAVPLLDMLRYHHFLIARLWIPEYGSADDPEQFKYIYEYSPYQHVREGERYPAVLLMTAESDSRVDPMHARKMAALLQADNASEHPILLQTETKAGHGVGKPLTKAIENATDQWTFTLWQLGVEP